MRKAIAIIFSLMICSGVFAQNRYSVSVQGVYDYSQTFGHQGGLDITGYMPINPQFEAEAALEYLSPRIFAGTIVARPKFPLKVGELFLDCAVHFRGFKTYDIGNFALAASFGYRMDYVSVQIGFESLAFIDLLKVRGDSRENISEPVNLIYRLAVNVRPYTSAWNISLGISSFTLYQYERPYQPIAFIDGHYDISERFTVKAEAALKPHGIFNMTTRFDEISFRTGLIYKFQ